MKADRWEPRDLLRHVSHACDDGMLSYLVVGSTATIAYREPPFTYDIDLPASGVDASPGGTVNQNSAFSTAVLESGFSGSRYA